MMDRRLFLCAPALLALPARATELAWRDESRQRTLPLRLRLPPGAAPVPLVLFSHGLGGNLDAGTDWAEAWAAAGIATLHLQHPGSDTEALRAGGLRGLRQAASGEQLRARALDVRFVLDELARRHSQYPQLVLEAVGLAGHSFGAHTTLAVAGRRYGSGARFAGPADAMSDPRPRAFAAFSPSPGDERLGSAGFAAITRPVLCLTGSLDANPLGEERTGEHRRAVYDALPRGAKAELWLDGADHMSFGGHLRGRGRARRPEPAQAQAERHRALIQQVSADWWRAQLLEDSAARQRLRARPPHLQAGDDWRQDLSA